MIQPLSIEFYCCTTPVFFQQTTVSLSTTEAKVVALAQAIPDAIWLRMLFKGIGVEQENETRMSIRLIKG